MESIDEYPPILYKYRCWDDTEEHASHKRLLSKREIYFAPPGAFNDPFDCRMTIQLDGLPLSKLRKKLDETRQTLGPPEPYETRRKLITNLIINHKKDPQGAIERMRRAVDDTTGIWSLSAEPRNLLMWAHYADCHRGLCVGFSTKALHAFSERALATSRLRTTFWRVKYTSKYSTFDYVTWASKRAECVETMLKTKSPEWIAEEEYRLVMLVSSKYSSTKRSYVLPEDAIQIVILGCRMEERCKSEVRSLLAATGCKARVVEAELKPHQYGLKIDIPDEFES